MRGVSLSVSSRGLDERGAARQVQAVDGVEWQRSIEPVDYPAAVADMETRARAIHGGTAAERVWLLEHPPLYTAGTSADPAELLDARFPVHATGRGGRHTYHGPGQRVAYVQLDLGARGRDVRRYVAALESWVVATLARFDVAAHVIPGRVGIWTGAGADEAKVGAIGVRITRWVTLHGLAVNLDPDLSHFTGIVPCGLTQPVTSLAILGRTPSAEEWDEALREESDAFLRAVSGS